VRWALAQVQSASCRSGAQSTTLLVVNLPFFIGARPWREHVRGRTRLHLPGNHDPENDGQVDDRGVDYAAGQDFRSGLGEFSHVI